MRSLAAIAAISLALLCPLQSRAEIPQKVLDAAKAVLDGWELDYADRVPKVDAGDGFKGYRAIFTKPYDEDVEKGVSRTNKPRFNHVDLVLVPQAKGLDQLEARTSIVWSQQPEELFSIPRWIGSGYGFEWFCRTNLMLMDEFRTKMKLSGGESKMSIMAAGLPAEDKDYATAKFAAEQLRPFGKAAIPEIVPAISSMSAAGKVPYAPMNALKWLNCPEADNALAAYFNSPDAGVSLAAGSALCIPPFVEKAKDAYLKILKDGRNIPQCAEACRLFGLGAEATQQLQAIAAAPRNLSDFSAAMLALSSMKDGKADIAPFDIAENIAALASHSGELPGTPQTFVMGETKESNKARLGELDLKRLKPLETQLANYPNKDMALVAALWLCMFNAPDAKPEYTARVRESGGRVMRALPRQSAELLLSRLSKKLANKEEAEAVMKIYRRTASLAGVDSSEAVMPSASKPKSK